MLRNTSNDMLNILTNIKDPGPLLRWLMHSNMTHC